MLDSAIFFILGLLTNSLFIPIIPFFEQKVNQETVYLIEDNNELVEEEPDIKELDNTCPIRVDISGALNNPGVYCFQKEELLIDAINKAGGFSNKVGMKFVSRKINLASTLIKNQKIYIPYEEDLICTLQDFQPYTKEVEYLPAVNMNQEGNESPQSVAQSQPEQSSVSSENTDAKEDVVEEDCININSGTKDQLILLNGVGESTAQKIIDSRPFKTIEDILKVSGIGEATFNKFKEQICL